jgi:predicted ATP-dependent protease
MTGTIGIKMDVGPVGGLGGFGTEAGKLVGILKTRRVEITDLILPRINYEIAEDDIRAIEEEGVKIHPIEAATEALPILFGRGERELLELVRTRLQPWLAASARFKERKSGEALA